MPRRQTRRPAPLWRRGRPAQPGLPIQLKGRQAKVLARELARVSQQAPTRGGTAAPNNAAIRAGWRWRRHMPPFVWAGGIATTGAILHATPHPLVYGIVAGAGASIVMVWSTRHLSTFAKRASDVAAFITAGWLPSLAALGFPKPIPALLALTWAPCAALWVRHYRWRPEPPGKADVPVSDIAIWNALAARRKWDAWLTDPEVIPGGVKWQIGMNGVETHIGNIIGEPKAIAAAYDRPQTEAYVEPHPSGIESKGTFTRLKAGTLQAVREWDGTGIDPETGMARIGRFADSQPARIRFFVRHDGVRHGLIAGATGGGKSYLHDLIIRIALTSGFIVPVVLDPQNGQSLPQWRDKLPYAAGIDECMVMLRGLEAGMLDRSRYLANLTWEDEGHKVRGMDFFDPFITGLPIVLAIMAEAPMLLGHPKYGTEAVRLTGSIGKLGRKTGESLWPDAQVPSLAELGDQVVRSMLVGGNVVCLRTGDRVSAGMVGLESDPYSLPKYFPDGSTTAGLGYVVGPDNRQAPMRVDLVPGRIRHAPVTVPQLDDRFAEAMDRAMGTQGVLLPSSPVADPAPIEDAPEGHRCIDAVWQVLSDRKAPMERGEIIAWVNDLARDAWERKDGFSIRSVGDALRDLSEGKIPGRHIVRVGPKGSGVYRVATPEETARHDQAGERA